MATSALPHGVTRSEAIEIANVREDPVRFTNEILRVNTWNIANEILESIATERQIAVKGCHASGKTQTVACAALWWLQRWEDAQVLVTGPTETQVKLSFWKELKEACDKSKLDFGYVGDTKLELTHKNFIRIRAAAKGGRGVKFQSMHAGHLLIICDEAPGIDAEIYEAIQGTRMGGYVVVIMLGNPTVPGGFFYDAFTVKRTRWKTITVSALDTPNMRGVSLEDIKTMDTENDGPLDDNPWPFLITKRNVRELIEEWGESNHRFESRVLGQFPQQAEGALIPLAWLEKAKYRETVRSNKRLSAGVDVAEAGEAETVLYVLDHGHIVAKPVCSTKSDSRGEIVAGLRPWKPEMGLVKYDSIGVGAYFGPHLRDQGYECVGVNVGRAASAPDKYVRLKDELYWSLREMFRNGEIAAWPEGAMESNLDETTIAQLGSIQYQELANGKIQVESKIDLAKRGVKSPDRAEALMIAASALPSPGPGPTAMTQTSILERELNLG